MRRLMIAIGKQERTLFLYRQEMVERILTLEFLVSGT